LSLLFALANVQFAPGDRPGCYDDLGGDTRRCLPIICLQTPRHRAHLTEN